MSETSRIITGIILVLILLVLFILIRKNLLKAKYSLLYIAIFFILIIFDIFPEFLFSLGSLLGFMNPTNLFLAVLIFLLLCISLYYAYILTQNERKIQDLAELYALLKNELDQIKKPATSKNQSSNLKSNQKN